MTAHISSANTGFISGAIFESIHWGTTGPLAKRFECSAKSQATGVQSKVESYQRVKKGT